MNVLFDENELICAGNLYENRVTPLTEVRSAEFFCVNPLSSVDVEYKDDENRRYMTPRRADMNVSKFRNFIFEMDTLSLEQQLILLEKCNIKWSSIVYSGGKSYHAILSLDEPLSGCYTKDGIMAYKAVWKQISAYIEAIGAGLGYKCPIIDASGKNPSRFTRFPEFHAKDRLKQDIVHIGERLSEIKFQSLLQKCPIIFTSKIIKRNSEVECESLEDFYKLCPESLLRQIKFPFWVQEAANYPELYRLTLWAIDDMMIEQQIWEEVCEKHIFPRFAEAGYPEDRWKTAISHAYNSKGM